MKKILIVFLIVFLCTVSLSLRTDAETSEARMSSSAYDACVKYGEEYGICPELLMAIIERESDGDPYAQNGNCCGLMQISTRWHSDRMAKLGVSDIYDEDGNIHVGADYICELFQKYGGDVAAVLMVFHGESGAVANAKAGNLSPYASGILARSSELEKIHGK